MEVSSKTREVWNMLKRVVVVLIFLGSTSFALQRAKVDAGKIDQESPLVRTQGVKRSYVLQQGTFTPVFEDSARNQYSFWTQYQDPIWSTDFGCDTIVFSWRGWEEDGTGFIAVWWTFDDAATYSLARRVNEIAGTFDTGGRYPSACWSSVGPIAAHPELTAGPDWGYATTLTGDWADVSMWYGDRSADLDVHKNWPAVLPDGNLLICTIDVNDNVYYAIYDPVDGLYTTPPTLLGSFSMSGIDYLDTLVMIFGFYGGGLAAWVYNANTGEWASEPTQLAAIPIETLDNGEVLNTLFWFDGVILNDGTPIAFTDLTSAEDPYLLSRTIWAIRPDTAVKIFGPGPGETIYDSMHVYYTQACINRTTGDIYVFWEYPSEWIDDTLVGYAMWDIWCSYSTDGGYTWSQPINITNSPDINESQFEVCKRGVYYTEGDTAYSKIYLAWMWDPLNNVDIYCYTIDFDAIVDNPYVELGYVMLPTRTSVEETSPLLSERDLSVFQDLKNGRILMTLSLKNSARGKVTLYDVTGRQVLANDVRLSKGMNTISVSTSKLPQGVYFMNLKAGEKNYSAKFFVIR